MGCSISGCEHADTQHPRRTDAAISSHVMRVELGKPDVLRHCTATHSNALALTGSAGMLAAAMPVGTSARSVTEQRVEECGKSERRPVMGRIRDNVP